MDWLYFLLDALVILAVLIAILSLAAATGVLLSRALQLRKTIIRYALTFMTSLAGLVIGIFLSSQVIAATLPTGRWLNLLLLALLSPLLAPLVWEALRFTQRELLS